MQVTTIGLDLAKHVFQIHGIDAADKVVVRRPLRRSQGHGRGSFYRRRLNVAKVP
jgi:hypothetical protein